jgi:cell wall assembly regulator SMI1
VKRPRIIGTTEEAVARAEAELRRAFPPSFRAWLRKNNGLYGVEDVKIFPVFDDRDARKTSDSIVVEYNRNWKPWLENFEADDFSHLLPFGEDGTGDYFCFDEQARAPNGEYPVVRWDHETGEEECCAANFSEFVERVICGDFSMD